MGRIFVSAAEASSDTHAAALIRALKRLSPEPIEFFGVGGPRSEAEGLEIVLPSSEFLSMGLIEVLKKIPKIALALRSLEKAVSARKPDLAIVMDYPDFHFKLASRLNALQVPVICMIPPKVWAWRSGRIHTIRKLYRHVLTILPFEKKYYEDAGVSATYVGNPLLDELPTKLDRGEARARYGLKDTDSAFLLMPGSRPAELRYHLEPMLEAAAAIQEKLRKDGSSRLKVLIPLAPGEEIAPIEARIRSHPASTAFEWRLSRGDAWEAMVASDAGIVKSGTSSLEAAVLGLPHVVIYKGHPITEWAFKTFVRYDRPISLVNLIHDFTVKEPKVVPELILERFSVENMVREAYPLLGSRSERAMEMRKRFVEVRDLLRQSEGDLSSPSDLAARKVLALMREARGVSK